MSQTEALQKRFAAALMPNYGMPPLAISRGQGCRVWDADGREYLDLIAGIAVSSLGHAHPAIVEAVSRQVAEVAHTSNLFLHEREVELAERLLTLLGEDGRVFFANSGTEANEAAVKLVRRIQGPGRPVIVAAERSFHGRTMGALALTGKESIRAPFGPFGLTVRFVPYGDAGALRAAVDADVAAVFLEPGLGESGVVPAPEGYLRAAREACDQAGALLVLDEIQSAIGRTGAWFAHQAAGVRPDVLTLAKGLGGGLPIGACIGLGAAGSRLRQGRPRLYLRRQPGRLRRGPGRARDDRARRAAGPRHRGGRAPGGRPGPDQPPAGVRGARPRVVAGGGTDLRGSPRRRGGRPAGRVPGQRGAAGRDQAGAAADPVRRASRRVHRRAARHPRGGQLMTRHFLRDDDLNPADQAAVLDLAEQMKKDRFGWQPLAGPRAVAVLFDKPSLRTRVSFSVGIAELGGYPLVIDTQTTHIGRGETIEDVARVLTRQVAAIAWRTSGQERIEALASAATVPVINALTDQFHPCQVLADLQTVRAHHGSLAGRLLTFLGDGSSNMAHSYLLGGATAGMRVRIGAPEAYHPDVAVREAAARIAAHTGGGVEVGTDPRAACTGADVIATDVWTSMGTESERDQRLAILGSYGDGDSYQLDGPKLALAQPGCLVLHCLPAHRGEEISADVIDGQNSVVWEQAENRLHAQKALLAWLCSTEPPRAVAGVEQS